MKQSISDLLLKLLNNKFIKTLTHLCDNIFICFIDRLCVQFFNYIVFFYILDNILFEFQSDMHVQFIGYKLLEYVFVIFSVTCKVKINMIY